MNAIIEKDREINKTAFENIIWMIGEPPSKEKEWRVNALEKTNNLTNLKKEIRLSISTIAYTDTLKALEGVWLKNRYEYHLSIGSLGSKMQHLGTFFFMLLHQDVGIWMAEPVSFQGKLYSTGFGRAYEIHFGNTEILNSSLTNYMKFDWKL